MGRILQNMGRYRDCLALSRFICILMHDNADCNVRGNYGSLTLARMLNCVCSKVTLQYDSKELYLFSYFLPINCFF